MRSAQGSFRFKQENEPGSIIVPITSAGMPLVSRGPIRGFRDTGYLGILRYTSRPPQYQYPKQPAPKITGKVTVRSS